jgi:hypothetical protein
MKRKNYPQGLRIILPKMILLACFIIIPMFIGVVLLQHFYPDSWASKIVAIIGMIVFAVALSRFLRRIYARMPCPECGQTNLKQIRSNDEDKWHILVCEHCETEWTTGLGSNPTSH